MRTIPVTNENVAIYIDYCRRHGAEHDESFLPADTFVPTEEFPAYLLTMGDDVVGAVGLMLTEPYRSNGKVRLTILHSVEGSAEAYAALLAAIRSHSGDLDCVYGFLPEAKADARRCWEDLGFGVERFAYALAYQSREIPSCDLPEGYRLVGLSPGDDEGIREMCELWNSNYRNQLGFVGVTPERMASWFGEDVNIPGGALLLRQGATQVGTAYVSRDDVEPTNADIAMLSVHPEYRGQGLGRLMLRAALGVALRQDLSPVYLSVNAENDSAVGLYLSEGFVKDIAMVCYTLAV